MATVTELLVGVTNPKQRARIKAQEHVARGGSLTGLTFTYSGVSIQITAGPTLVNDCVSVSVSAWTGAGSKKVFLPVDNPYLFYNPPIRLVVTPPVFSVGAKGKITLTTPATTQENIIEAAKSMLGEAVLTVARSRGWTG